MELENLEERDLLTIKFDNIPKKINKWDKQEVEFLKIHWNAMSIEQIAEELKRTYKSIYMKARTLKLGRNTFQQRKNWTKEEENYLEESWGTVSKEVIAKNLDRTEEAIQLKAQKMKLGPFLEAGDYITLNQLMNEIRGSYVGKGYTVDQWIEKGLPVKTQKVKTSSFKIINLDDFWKWAKKNRTLIDFSKLEPLILGEEPKWLKDQRKADKEKTFFKTTPWTEQEDKKLKRKLNEYRYNYRELSLRMKRTEGAIKRRMIDLNIKARPIKMSNHNPWTEKETELLIELYHKGHSRDTMANYINRSSQACGGKVERLIKEGIISPRTKYRTSC